MPTTNTSPEHAIPNRLLSVVLILSGIVSLAGATRILAMPQSQGSSSTTNQKPSHSSSHRETPHFQITVMADGYYTADQSVHLGFTVYKASDGGGLEVAHGWPSSPQAAQQYLEKVNPGQFEVVLQRGKKLDKKGNVIGERIRSVSIWNGHWTYVVAWTNKSDYFDIRSDSLPDLLELEKLYTP